MGELLQKIRESYSIRFLPSRKNTELILPTIQDLANLTQTVFSVGLISARYSTAVTKARNEM